MKILALDFSSARRSAAVSISSAKSCFEASDSSPGRDMRPFALIESVLQQAAVERDEIDHIAVGLGPGSYAGIRVAISLAQGWQLGTDVKLIGISSVEAIAQMAASDLTTGGFHVVIDAQRGEFYTAGYAVESGGFKETSALRITTMEEMRRIESAGELIVGPEATRWFERGVNAFPSAKILAEVARRRTDFVAGESLEPIYLRETTFVKSPPSRIIP